MSDNNITDFEEQREIAMSRAVGLLVAVATRLEEIVYALILTHVSGLDQKKADIFYWHLIENIPFKTVLNLLQDFVKADSDAAAWTQFKGLRSQIDDFFELRNDILHKSLSMPDEENSSAASFLSADMLIIKKVSGHPTGAKGLSQKTIKIEEIVDRTAAAQNVLQDLFAIYHQRNTFSRPTAP